MGGKIMNVLLSIKPRFVEKILDGVKRFEFRKGIFKQDVEKVYIYSSYPIKEIVGYFKIGVVHTGSPQNIWRKCGKEGSISKEEFFKYFEGKEIAFGIEIDELIIFEQSVNPRDIFPEFIAPQSYYYLNEKIEKILNQK